MLTTPELDYNEPIAKSATPGTINTDTDTTIGKEFESKEMDPSTKGTECNSATANDAINRDPDSSCDPAKHSSSCTTVTASNVSSSWSAFVTGSHDKTLRLWHAHPKVGSGKKDRLP